jgi:uncharacterized protein
MKNLANYTVEISKFCALHKVKSLYAFGSVLTEKFNEKSDIDLSVEFLNMEIEKYADNYFDFKFSLQDILHRDIDLIETKAIKNPYFKDEIFQKRELIYGQ